MRATLGVVLSHTFSHTKLTALRVFENSDKFLWKQPDNGLGHEPRGGNFKVRKDFRRGNKYFRQP